MSISDIFSGNDEEAKRKLHSEITSRRKAIRISRYTSLPDILYVCIDDFPDNHWEGKGAIILREMSDSDTVEMGRSFLTALSSGVSQYDVGCIFLLAFQLKNPEKRGVSTRMFPAKDEISGNLDYELDTRDKFVTNRYEPAQHPVECGTTAQLAQAYSFIAASTLRIFTKPPDNYLKSWRHIINGYRNFYCESCPVTGVTPNPSVLETIRLTFEVIFKSTLYRFLYNANRNGTTGDLQCYLYDNDLSHTGMHVVPIADKICTALDCSIDLLLKGFNAKRFGPQLKGLKTAFGLMRNTDDGHKRQMWRYGRIFETTFLSTLQTKARPEFVYMLACVLQRARPESNANILNIKQLEGVRDDLRARLKENAKYVIEAIDKSKLRKRVIQKRGFSPEDADLSKTVNSLRVCVKDLQTAVLQSHEYSQAMAKIMIDYGMKNIQDVKMPEILEMVTNMNDSVNLLRVCVKDLQTAVLQLDDYSQAMAANHQL